MVQEGEITYTVKGEKPKVLKAGDAVYIPRGNVHRNQNLSGQPVRTVELMIVDKDKPHTEPVTTAASRTTEDEPRVHSTLRRARDRALVEELGLASALADSYNATKGLTTRISSSSTKQPPALKGDQHAHA